MNFKIEGDIDIERILMQRTEEEKAKELAHQILENHLKIKEISMEHKIYKRTAFNSRDDFYNPTMQLICFKDSSLEERNNIFNKSFEKLEVDKYPLTIIDPYIFAKGTDTKFLIELLRNNVKSKKVSFITWEKKTDKDIMKEISNRLLSEEFEVHIFFHKNLHDRVWFTEKGGFMCGTSINGIGKKDFTVFTNLDDEDVKSLNSKYPLELTK